MNIGSYSVDYYPVFKNIFKKVFNDLEESTVQIVKRKMLIYAFYLQYNTFLYNHNSVKCIKSVQ